MNNDELNIYYFRISDIWKRLCELHNELFGMTCDEYKCLLSSDIEGLEKYALLKSQLIEEISELELQRQEVILKIGNLANVKIDSVQELLKILQNTEAEKSGRHFYKFNQLLVDIIDKIKDQNKKNQLLIRKSIQSLREIRETASGVKSYSVYNSVGTERRVSGPSSGG